MQQNKALPAVLIVIVVFMVAVAALWWTQERARVDGITDDYARTIIYQSCIAAGGSLRHCADERDRR